MQYQTVEEYFGQEYPHLLDGLGRPGGFWPAVKANTISNDKLVRTVEVSESMGKLESETYQAAKALALGRLAGKIANPTNELGAADQSSS